MTTIALAIAILAPSQELDFLKPRTWLPLERLGVEVRLRDPREHGRKQKNGLKYDDFASLTAAKTSAWPMGSRLRIRSEYGYHLDLVVMDNDLGGKPGKIDNALYLPPLAWSKLTSKGRNKPSRWEISVER